MKKEHTSIRLDPAVLARLKDMAQERSTTATALIDLAIERFLAHETVVGELRGMEQRLAATIVRGLGETARVGDDVQLVIAQVDQLIRFMFQVTPEVFDKDAAAIVGSRRYAGFLESFAKEFVSRKRRAGFAAKVEDAMAGDSN
ncbi:CopG family transcriptional regulator [Paraburkholderia caledonica]|uniref:ribbon-helix-helix domain-containing protein n=1 Tax=Paraburkholderia caledonica TaxID=134536 RepID=UPI000487A9C4|nr:CopG family transcriptional regulator [Paraburkholderia caledonica]